jgi:O-antigen ligase
MDRFMRASGSFHQPNPYAGYLGLTLPVAASLALWAWGTALRRLGSQQLLESDHEAQRTGSWLLIIWIALYTTAATVITAGLLASWSRGGWLGAAAGLIPVLLMRSRQAFMIGALVLVTFFGTLLVGSLAPALVPPLVAARLLDIPTFLGLTDILSQPVTDENFSVIERVAHWVAALRMWEQAPWLGVGPGNYALVYPDVRLPLWEEPLGHAHNIYLNTLGETGLIGLAVFLLFWSVCLVWVGRRARQAQKRAATWWSALAIGITGVLVHLNVHNFFDNLFVQGIYLHIALWLAALFLYDEPL